MLKAARRRAHREGQVSDLNQDEIWVVVAPENVRASIEAAYRLVDRALAPALVPFALAGPARAENQRPALVKAGPFLLWPFDPYEDARLDRAVYGSEIGCRLGDD
jgi:hypothetical protein